MYGKIQNRVSSLLLIILPISASLIGFTTHANRTTYLSLQTFVLDVSFCALAIYAYLFNEHLLKARDLDLTSLSKAHRHAIRAAFNKGKLPTNVRLRPAAMKYAKADIRYQEATLSPAGIVGFALFSIVFLLLINRTYQLYWNSSSDIYGDLLPFVVAGLLGLSIGANARKKKAQRILHKDQ